MNKQTNNNYTNEYYDFYSDELKNIKTGLEKIHKDIDNLNKLNIFSTNPVIGLIKVFLFGSRITKILAIIFILFVIAGITLASVPRVSGFGAKLGQLLLVSAALLYLIVNGLSGFSQQIRQAEKIQKAEMIVDEYPDKARPLWNLARERLEVYFQRNLSQIRYIFWITVFVMLSGFVLIAYGVFQAFGAEKLSASILTTSAGILTEFIAATFLVIYKSTLNQANNHVKTLERINAVGMAIQILDSIPTNESQIKNETRVVLVSQIFNIFSNLELGKSKDS